MRINNNMMAMNTHRQLGTANAGGAKSMEKLSSGMRINRAGDDAAGLAISEKMRGQIRGLNQASANSQDGISLIQTAEGALNETHAILQRMRELAVQSSTDTNTDADRGEIQKEVDQLAAEVTRIAETTQFNTMELLDGTFEDKKFHIGANEGQNLNLKVSDMRANKLSISGNAKTEVVGVAAVGADTAAQIAGGAADGKYTIDGTNLKDKNGTVVATTSDGKVWTGNDAGALGDDTITFVQAVDSGSITILDNAVTGVSEFETELQPGDYKIKYAASNKSQLLDASGKVIGTTADDITFTSTDGKGTTLLKLDAAATADMDFTAGGIDVSSQASASSSITVINDALEVVSGERSKLGALQNRLEHTIKNLDTSAENLQASEARIRDVDMAKEMMEQTKQNILAQASTAMLANANQAPQAVLQLLG